MRVLRAGTRTQRPTVDEFRACVLLILRSIQRHGGAAIVPGAVGADWIRTAASRHGIQTRSTGEGTYLLTRRYDHVDLTADDTNRPVKESTEP